MRNIEEEVPLTTHWLSHCFFLMHLKVLWWLVWVFLYVFNKENQCTKKTNPETKQLPGVPDSWFSLSSSALFSLSPLRLNFFICKSLTAPALVGLI